MYRLVYSTHTDYNEIAGCEDFENFEKALDIADYKKALNDIYKKIKKLNYDAVFERYKEDYSIEFVPVSPFWFTGRPTHQDYKTLQCYLYQCCEGDVPETKMYKALEKLQDRIARYMVEHTEEYENAHWGEYDE